MIQPRLPFLLALSALIPAACGDGQGRATTETTTQVDGVRISARIDDPWCRPTPRGVTAGACYLTVTSSDPDRLTAVSSPAAASVEIHDMTMDGDMMRMSVLPEGLPLEANTPVTLAPGGKHLMLTGLTAPLAEGQTVALTLTFESGRETSVQATVRQPGEGGSNHSGH